MSASPKNIINKNASVLFATFAVYVNGSRLPANGMIEQMTAFFVPRVKQFDLLIQPHPSSEKITPLIETYRKKKKDVYAIPPVSYFPLYIICRLRNTDRTHISFKLRDLFSVVFAGLKKKDGYDFVIGLESVNALGGILLKKLGRARTVIYYVSDYAPVRYQNALLNSLYRWLDEFCVKHADVTWDVSPAVKQARLSLGLPEQYAKRIIHVPNGVFPEQINPLPISKRIPDSMVYVGMLNPEQHGVELALKAFKIVLKKKPSATFHVIGGTNRKKNPFADMVKKLGIQKSVIMHGFIPAGIEMTSIINQCMIGVSTYQIKNDPRNPYGDSGKIKIYLACGLPIVATKLQWYTNYVIQKGAGIGVEENPDDFASALLTLFSDTKRYKKSAEIALELSKHNTWDRTYSNAFRQMRKQS